MNDGVGGAIRLRVTSVEVSGLAGKKNQPGAAPEQRGTGSLLFFFWLVWLVFVGFFYFLRVLFFFFVWV